MNTVITIGREFGSGGRELGRRLAEELGFDYYDKEIVKEIARKTAFSEQYIHQVVEKNPHDLFPITIGHSFSYVDSYALQQRLSIFTEQENVIKEMAEKSNCVIVGRCADYILREVKPFRIFVYADMKSKLTRCKKANEQETMNLTDKKIIKKIKKIDKQRKAYYEFFTGYSWGNKLNYDLCVNTSLIDIKEFAKNLADMFREEKK